MGQLPIEEGLEHLQLDLRRLQYSVECSRLQPQPFLSQVFVRFICYELIPLSVQYVIRLAVLYHTASSQQCRNVKA